MRKTRSLVSPTRGRGPGRLRGGPELPRAGNEGRREFDSLEATYSR